MDHRRQLFAVEHRNAAAKQWHVPVNKINHEEMFEPDAGLLEVIV